MASDGGMSDIATVNTSLPDTLKRFVDTQVAAGGYNSASEYIVELIRQDQKKKLQQRLEELLLDGLESGEPIVVSAAYWDAKRQALADESPGICSDHRGLMLTSMSTAA
jgi:antitoxin ParD1/3/4